MSKIVLKDRNGIKNTYSGVDVIKIADDKGDYNNYIAEPIGDLKVTENGTFDVKKKATVTVAVEGDVDLTEINTLIGEGA